MAPLFPSSPSHTMCSLWLHATLIVVTAWPHTVRRRHGFGDLTMYGNSIQHSISSCGTMVP